MRHSQTRQDRETAQMDSANLDAHPCFPLLDETDRGRHDAELRRNVRGGQTNIQEPPNLANLIYRELRHPMLLTALGCSVQLLVGHIFLARGPTNMERRDATQMAIPA